jgi:hypothetical protein
MPAITEPAIIAVCDGERDVSEEEARRTVTMGVTIWGRKEVSWACPCGRPLHSIVKKLMNGVLRPRKWRGNRVINEGDDLPWWGFH